MRSTTPVSLLATVFITVSIPAQATFARGWYQDKTLGFMVRPPAQWRQIPTKPDEQWIVGLFQSKKEYTNKEGYSKKLMMRIIMFDNAPPKKKEEEKEKEGKKEDKVSVIRFGRNLIHRNFQDYVKRTQSGGGFYFNVNKPRKSGVPGRMYEVKIEKLSYGGKRRLVAWDFTQKNVSFAIEFDVYEEHYKKLTPLVKKVFRSFKFVARNTFPSEGEAEGAIKIPNDEDWKKLPVTERHRIRLGIEAEQERKLMAKLPKDWKVTKSKHFLVISHGDPKFTKAIVNIGEACFAWLERRFDGLSDEYVRRSIIRICKDYDEYQAYHSGGSGGFGFSISFGSFQREVSELQFYDGERMNYQWSYFMQHLFRHYLRDKDDEFMDDAPDWLSRGIYGMLSGTVVKGRRVSFQPTVSARIAIAKLKKKGGFKNGSLKNLRDLMSMTGKEFYDLEKKNQDAAIRYQLGYLMRFLEGPGRKHKLFGGKDFLVEYCRAATAAYDQYKKDNPTAFSATVKEATTEEEEEEQAAKSRARSERYSKERAKRDRTVLNLVNGKACNWTDMEWKSLNKAYARTVK